MTSFIYKNCTVGEVTGMSDLSFGFNILNERGHQRAPGPAELWGARALHPDQPQNGVAVALPRSRMLSNGRRRNDPAK